MEEENILDFNFWPSFADLMLALVLLLVLVLALVAAVISVGAVDLSQVDKNQKNMVQAIASSYGKEAKALSKDVFGISIADPKIDDVIIKNEPTLQQITFSDHVLFQPDDYRLNPRGEEILRTVGAALKQQLPLIKEIQIQGHADTDRTGRFQSNTQLAAMRAIQVFEFLQKSVGIDPAEHLMSATSFGEFKPVQRSAEVPYNSEKLLQDNRSPELKSRNRRIELLLFYKL
ncbi:MAG: OmpA family protein [Acidobacteria bacterium]|nr:OmpA family protein [Acidobacteriota bacterium]